VVAIKLGLLAVDIEPVIAAAENRRAAKANFKRGGYSSDTVSF
jgi:hypothetical protein